MNRVKFTNPLLEYGEGPLIGYGAWGQVFLMTRKTDQKKFVMKCMRSNKAEYVKNALKEAFLPNYLNISDKVTNCVEFYYYNR